MSSAWLFNIGASIYAAMNAQRWWRASCDSLAAHLPTEGNPRVLDLGCGPGFSTIAVARAHPDAWLVGLDLAPRMLREAQRRIAAEARRSEAPLESSERSLHAVPLPQHWGRGWGVGSGPKRVSLVQGSAGCLPFRTSSFDAVAGHSFLYLVDEPAAVLAEVRRVLRPAGLLMLMEPNDRVVPLSAVLAHSRDPRFLFSVLIWRPYSRLHGRFTAATLGATLEAAGFEDFGSEEVLAGLGLVGWARQGRDGETR